MATAAAAVLVLLPVLVAAPAAAHAQLVSSTPAEGAVVAQAPESVELEFNERVQVHDEDTHVFLGDGTEVDARAVSQDRVVTVTPSSELAQGTVVVSYSITSADGHRINGSVTFAVGEPTPGSSSNEVFQEPVTAGVGAAARASAGLALLAGAVLLVLALLGWRQRQPPPSGPASDPGPPGSARSSWERTREVCWQVGLAAAVLALPLQVVHRGELGWSGLLAWEHWIDGFVTWRGLLVLVALVAAAVAVGALRRTSSVVAVVAAAVLACAGASAVAVPGADPVPVSGVPAGDPVGEATAGETTVRVSFERLMVGTTELEVEVLDPDGDPVEPFRPPRLRLHSDTVDLGRVVLEKSGPGAYRGRATLPEAGEWTVEVSLRVDRFTNPVLELPFTVGRAPTPEGGGGGH